MRIASRMVGALVMLAGFALVLVSVLLIVSGFSRRSVLVEPSPSKEAWIGGAFFTILGVVLILFGWNCFRLDVDKPDEAPPISRFAPYFLDHRRELKFAAQLGLAVSLIRFSAVCLGADWPGRWADWLLIVAELLLATAQRKMAFAETGARLDWESVPERVRPMLKTIRWAGGAVFVALALLFAWNQWAHLSSWAVLRAGFAPLLFGSDVIFFKYGKLRPDRQDV